MSLAASHDPAFLSAWRRAPALQFTGVIEGGLTLAAFGLSFRPGPAFLLAIGSDAAFCGEWLPLPRERYE